MSSSDFQHVWRTETPDVLAALLRRTGDLESAEDAVQEALLAAAQQWPVEGAPDNPRGWLIRVASRRLIDAQRAETARQRRELDDFVTETATPPTDLVADQDDSLQLMLLCAHPALTDSSAVALTLMAVAGLTTAQIASAFAVTEASMAQRITRAKTTVRQAGSRFELPDPAALPGRLRALRPALYLMFTLGHTAPKGERIDDADLADEAIRLTEQLHAALPDDPESAGLLALMLLTRARAAARVDAAGDLVPLADQDRTRSDTALIARGSALVQWALPRGDVGPFQLQAAIAAVHGEAATAQATDWLQICLLYRMLAKAEPSPIVELNLAAAIGMAHDADAGLRALEPLRDSQSRQHRFHAARAHLLERAGRNADAHDAYRQAARLTQSLPEQRYLNACARRTADRP